MQITQNIQHSHELYQQHKEDIINLYLEAFYPNNKSDILRSNIAVYFDQIIKQGFGIFSFEKGKLIALLMAVQAEFVQGMPKTLAAIIESGNTLYIAEVCVSKKHQGQGLGKTLMKSLFEQTQQTHNCYIIRALSDNKAAIGLYKKFGFEAQDSFIEQKIDLSGNPVSNEKLYLVRKENTL